MKRNGTKTEPWGIPQVRSEGEDFISFTDTTCVLSCRKERYVAICRYVHTKHTFREYEIFQKSSTAAEGFRWDGAFIISRRD